MCMRIYELIKFLAVWQKVNIDKFMSNSFEQGFFNQIHK